jgi:TIR domain
MQVIDELVVRRIRGPSGIATIQLLEGDLAQIPAKHAVDALVVSAFPNSYVPSRGTLFASLARRGLKMEQVARNKQEDERGRLGCWLSRPLSPRLSQQFHFKRIICFEPRYPEFLRTSGIDEDDIGQTVGFVFRCLNNFVIPDRRGRRQFAITKLAMPLLATGNQRVPVETIVPRLLEAAVFWLEEGLPVEQLKIVAFLAQNAAIAKGLFRKFKASYEQRGIEQGREGPGVAAGKDWQDQLALTLSRDVIPEIEKQVRQRLTDAALPGERPLLRRLFERVDRRRLDASSGLAPDVGGRSSPEIFISYAHKQEREVHEFVRALKNEIPGRKIFFDRTSIPAGGQWIKMLSDALQQARTFVAVLSPDYTASPVCWDEFQCAKLKEYTTRQSMIKTIRLYSEKSLPPMIGIHSYIDCAEGNLRKLRKSAKTILE